KLVPKSTTNGDTQRMSDGNVGFRDLREDVGGCPSVFPKRQCIRQSDSILQRDSVARMPAATHGEQGIQLSPATNVNVPESHASLGVQQPTTPVSISNSDSLTQR
ncbi:hypothetical protein Tco_0668400, partial [Tanacetum coccineum]